jgi:hypothetical protein
MGSRTASEGFDARPVRMFRPSADADVDESRWPGNVPAVAQLFREGMELPAGLTVLVGANQAGFYLMDEPDAPLSFTASLGLAAMLHDLAAAGSQLVVATHSPILAAVPGARLLELGGWGIRPASWDDLDLVVAWRQFMRDPRSFFRHLLEDSL